ncbi:MAG TPA: hypothetical protein VKZ92_06235 [Pseudohongiella sp.]|nr:hypothetical protein [Pseudohongiella sp.]
MIMVSTLETAGYQPFFPLTRHITALNYLVKADRYHFRLALVDNAFSLALIAICVFQVSSFLAGSNLDFIVLAVACVAWRTASAWVLWRNRFKLISGSESVCFRFNIFTRRWMLLHLSVAMLWASASAFGVEGNLLRILQLLSAVHAALLLWPFVQWSLLGLQTKKPIL